MNHAPVVGVVFALVVAPPDCLASIGARQALRESGAVRGEGMCRRYPPTLPDGPRSAVWVINREIAWHSKPACHLERTW